ncbi:hypothetical protein VBD025_13620 [Virgibacillus flavescens]|uniref:hypothetical protein n=1 Tax=Virgibacillus flavescens TaxID=1611422 RepID=UPI003D32BA27
MNKEIKVQIENSDIPKILKEYFLRNPHVHLYLNESLLKDVEETYIEYDSLYEFDQAEFCSYIITGIKKQDKHEYFYHYLKKVLDSNLNLIPKSKISDYQKVLKIGKSISKVKEDEIPQVIIDLLKFIDDFNKTKNLKKLLLAHKLIGILQVLFTLYPENPYKKDFKHISSNLDKLS